MSDQPTFQVMHAGAQPASRQELFRRKLPGHAHRNKDGEVAFIKGRVVHSGWGKLGSTSQIIETDSPIQPYVKLVGHTYIYWCPHCKLTIFEQEYLLTGTIRSSDPAKQKCPFFGCPITPVQPGTRVRCHYRFSKNGTSGAWWAEVWE